MQVITHEIKHDPVAFDPRGGPTTADHVSSAASRAVSLLLQIKLTFSARLAQVDILGSSELNEAILNIAAGRDDLVKDQIISKIEKYASKIKWDLA